MKKLTALIFTVSLCLGLCSFAVSATDGDILYGDVSGEGTVNSLDAAQILKLDAQLISLSDEALAAADVNDDGTVNSLDAAQVLKYDAQLIDVFPVNDNESFEETSEEMSVDTSKETSEETSENISFGDVEVGDYITFGSYEQDNDLSNGTEAIEWLVLDIEDGKAFVLSKYALDCQQYNTSYGDVTWETCTLRSWLNEEFINKAFTLEEQTIIPTVTVANEGISFFGAEGGNDTQDKVFLLSTEEAQMHLDYLKKVCVLTAYAEVQEVYTITPGPSPIVPPGPFDGNCCWWLRSPGETQNYAAHVTESGEYGYSLVGYYFFDSVIAVRPAMWIELD